jgi:hypothetical protein
MRDKYYIRERGTDAVIGLRYDPENGELKAGGPKVYMDWFGTVLSRFGIDVDALEWNVNVNRATVTVTISTADWHKGWAACLKAGYIVEQVESFRRFMS